MKSLFLLFTVLGSMSLSAQVLEVNLEDVKSLEEAKRLGITEQMIQSKIQSSKSDVLKSFEIDDQRDLELKSIQVKIADAKMLKTATEEDCISCSQRSITTSASIDSQSKSVLEAVGQLKEVKAAPKGVLFVTWGYNRGFHTKSDITVKTPDGKIVIKDAVGVDRPSKFSLKYLKPSKFSVPQYNLKVGYWFSKDSKFGIGAGTDHMKWVFDEQQQYDIEGHFNKPLWVRGEQKDFEEIKAGKDASFLMLEHTDGYNYPYLEALYRESLLATKRVDIDFVAGGGAGLLVPKTRTRVADREDSGQYRDIDNKFKVAGFGVHADVSLMIKYKKKNGVSFFVKPTVRGVAGKINNALYLGSEDGSISQSVIYTLEPSVNIGTEIPLSIINNPEKRMRRREARKLRKMKKLEQEENKELTLEQLQEKMNS